MNVFAARCFCGRYNFHLMNASTVVIKRGYIFSWTANYFVAGTDNFRKRCFSHLIFRLRKSTIFKQERRAGERAGQRGRPLCGQPDDRSWPVMGKCDAIRLVSATLPEQRLGANLSLFDTTFDVCLFAVDSVQK